MPCPPLPPEDLEQILASTLPLWEEVRGQALFVTGGTGFFGIWLLESFARANEQLQLNARVTVLTRDPRAFAAKAPHLAHRADIEFVTGDLHSFAFPAGRYPFLIHAAHDVHPVASGKSPQELLDHLALGINRLLDFAAQCGTKKLLLTSSGAVYGPQPPGLRHMPEDQPWTPLPLSHASVYALGKRMAEAACIAHAGRSDCEMKIARCFAFVGPHLPLNGGFAAGNFIRDALKGGSIEVAGDGTPYRSYLYAADLAVWLWQILFRGQSTPYNVGSADDLTIAELGARVAAAAGGKATVAITRQPPPHALPSRYVPAIDRAKRELNLAPHIPLDSALRRTIRWYRPFFE